MSPGSRTWPLRLVWAAAGATVVAFFLPWARLEVRDPAIARVLASQAEVGEALGQLIGNAGRVTIAIEQPDGVVAADLAALAALPSQVTGAQLPRLLQEERMQVALAVADLWQAGPRQPWTQRSRAVYAVPGLALLLAALLTQWGRRPVVAWSVAAVLLAAAGGSAWWWRTHDFATPTVVVTLGVGLWSTWWAYLVMAWAAAWGACQQRSRDT